MRRWLSAALWLSLCALALAQTGVQLELLNERLTTAEESRLERALNHIWQLYRRLGLAPEPRIRARLFSSYHDFQAFQREQRQGTDALFPSQLGYFNPVQREVVLWRSRRFSHIFIHEAQHALLRSAFPRPPKWLNEGLSEYFEGINADTTPIRVEPQGPRLRRLSRYLQHPEFGQRVVSVVGMSPREFDARSERGLDSYTCSWALNYYLWSRPDGERLLGAVLSGCREGRPGVTVLGHAYPGGLSALENEIGPFYRQLLDSSPPVSE